MEEADRGETHGLEEMGTADSVITVPDTLEHLEKRCERCHQYQDQR